MLWLRVFRMLKSSIYTKTGDFGSTTLFGGKRILKSNIKVEAYGAIDELNSFIGLLTSKNISKEDKELLTNIQKDLYQIMNILSGIKNNLPILNNNISNIEQYIDKTEEKLPKLNHFILPQGTEICSWFHILRTVCRRAEREVVKYFKQTKTKNLEIMKYLNRLSDLFFIMARKYNKKEEVISN